MCEQAGSRTTYLWDGDVPAEIREYRHNRLYSIRHLVFDGWQLLAQQVQFFSLNPENRQELIAGNIQTQYAVCAPTGEPLALFDTAGHRVWRQPPQSLYGLRLGVLGENAELNPGLKFAGQWLDDESGLVYNRFRYYSPVASCYLTTDPIGLLGGGNPYAYVSNPTGQIDPLGLASCPLKDIFNDVDKWSLSKIGERQKGMIRDKLPVTKERSSKLNKKMREHFSDNERALIKEWEKQTGNTWPTLANGKRATPHHVIPLKNGGTNEWWNLIPVKHPHTGTIHGTGSALRTHIPYQKVGGKIWNLLSRLR
ncbi:RHS repeat-associated core domain-containing protein [Xenorhabdus szentirmaii]|uniref:RHS repeat-associated core domain-containing protein n=1 Tax=Xenorhabdus szentirmaii TaxID=290112 RepID=UPI0038CD3F5A